jgi:hypothetical protein
MTFLSFVPLTYALNNYQSEVTLARQFLLSLYDEEVGLLKESPLLQQNYYGLQSDNYLAYQALEGHFPDVEVKILSKLKEYNYTNNSKYEAVFNGQNTYLPFVIQDKQVIANHTIGEDDFNRGVLGGNWSNTGGTWVIEGNKLKGSDGKHICYLNTVKMQDGDIIVKLNMTEGTYIGVVLRMRANNEYLVCWLNTVGGGEAKLQEHNQTGSFDIDWYSFPFEVGKEYTVRFELAGTIHRFYVNDLDLENEGTPEPLLQANSSINTSAGWCGVMVDSSVVGYFDDFEVTDYRIYNMFDTEEYQTDYEEYSDLCMVASAAKWNEGDRYNATRLFEKALSYFDGIGFNDTHLHTPYLAYQLGLCLSVANLIEYDLGSTGANMQTILWSLQREDGGIPTHYTDIGVSYGSGEPNCETTSFAVLSEKEPFRKSDNTFVQMLSPEVLFVAGAVVLVCVLFIFIRRVF